MATKKSKAAPTDDELGELFQGIGDEPSAKKSTKSKPTSAASKAMADQDILAELENQLSSQTPSRPHTPRLKEATARGSPARRTMTGTPPPGDEKPAPRKSTDSARSLRASFTPSVTSSEMPESDRKPMADPTPVASAGGGWWGGLLSTASAAMKQAEAAVTQIQQNEEARKWADQVRGNVGALRGFSKCFFGALPCCRITSVLYTGSTHLS
jgi:hypothetical protein